MNLKACKKTPVVSTATKLMYGSGDMGYCMVTSTLSSFLMFYGTAVCGVSGSLMGLAIALGTLWDALTDPIVGYFSDRTKSILFGRRHGFLLTAIFGLSIINILLWSIPLDLSPFIKFLYFFGCLIAFQLFSTFYATPHSALSVELTNDYTERTAISSVKSVFLLIGSIVPTLLMAILQQPTAEYADGRYNPQSYITMAYIGSSCFLVLGVVCFIGSFSHVPRLRAQAQQENLEKLSLIAVFKNFFVVFKKPMYRNLVLGYSISLMASSFLTAAGFHMFTYTFKLSSTNMYLLIAAVFVMTILSQPLWIWFVSKFDKRSAVLLGIILMFFGVMYLLFVFLIRESIGDVTLIAMPALVLAGIGMGSLYSMPTAMLGDTNDLEKQRTKQDNTATYAGFMTFCNKTCNAASLLIVGVLLDIIGFNEGSPVQTPVVEWGLGWLVIGGILMALLGGFIFYSKYDVKKADIVKLAPVEEPSKSSIINTDGRGKRRK